MQNNLKNIIESLLFVADNPIDVRTFKQVTEADTKEIRDALGELTAEYEARQGGFLLHEVAGGFQFRTRPDYKDWIKKLVKPSPVRLSKAALETLAIIAYHQPIIRADVERIRGVDSGAIIRGLLERKLVRILGKKEIPGRPLIYATTRRFLETFNLKSLSDMPTLKEIQEFGKTGMPEDLAAELAERQEQPEGEASAGPEAEAAGSDGTDSPEPDTETGQTDEFASPESDTPMTTADEPVSAEQDMDTPDEADETVMPPEPEPGMIEGDDPVPAELENADTSEETAVDSSAQTPDVSPEADETEEKHSEDK